ncbi:hypothetical protein PV779_33440 [Streptomyces sp. ID01-9D]|nr:hypothetical protein [Streptomyces sp. ID01-9D]
MTSIPASRSRLTTAAPVPRVPPVTTARGADGARFASEVVTSIFEVIMAARLAVSGWSVER